MIVFVGRRKMIDIYLAGWGEPLAGRICRLSYSEVLQARRLPVCTYIFADTDLLAPDEAAWVAMVSTALQAAGCLVLNHPLRSLRRYELLRVLRERGVNTFDAYRATEARWPRRYPVFLRELDEHGGLLTPLLFSREELEAALAEQVKRGLSRDATLIVEFCETGDAQGIYRKYSAFVVGTRVVPAHIAFSKGWVTKGATELFDEDVLLEERRYVFDNPHEAALRDIFTLANISYGRIDYGLLDGALQVWEINTNPWVLYRRVDHPARLPAISHCATHLHEAFHAIDARDEPSRSIPNPARRSWVRANMRKAIGAGLTALGAGRYASGVIAGIAAGEAAWRRAPSRFGRPETPPGPEEAHR
jgi:hypothetical protein